MFNELRLIIWKNLIIRKRHWFLTIVEIFIPILLFTTIAYGRSKISGFNKEEVTEPQIYDAESEDLLFSHIPIGELQIWYAPYTTFTEKIVRDVQLRFQLMKDSIREFNSEDDLLNFYNNHHATDTETIVGIVFDVKDPKKLDYDLRVHEKYLSWETDKLFGSLFADYEGAGSKYIYKGFIGLQIAINKAFLATTLNSTNSNLSISLQQFPYPPHTKDSGINDLFLNFLPLITIFSFIFLCPAVLKRVIEEKASGIKELMKMVGLKTWMLWLGWFIHGLFTNLFSIIIIVILMKVPFWGVEYPPIELCSGTVLFMFLFLYCMTAITFCFLISAIFSKPSIGMVFGILIWIFSYFLPRAYLTNHENIGWKSKVLFGLFPNMALQYGYNAISVYESREIGVQWNNLSKSGSGGEDDITMLNVFIILIVDMILFMLLTIYIDNVNPGEYGIAKPMLYPIKFLSNLTRNRKPTPDTNSNSELASLKSYVEPGKGFEPCIEIKHLSKRYNANIALDNLSLDIYKNQITVLLGENGAGKTTTMSILTGMTSATSGCIQIDGKDLRCNIDQVRQEMGLCPQHNLLFPDLTVKEHLKFFAMLKGRSLAAAGKEADELLEKLNLSHRKNYLPCKLSGGMKRKLCLGMALIGDSKVLVLDEPTSGMDYESRYSMWEFFKELRKTKTILITTHFMDEADALADWICILYRGRLQCYGTPMFLKKNFQTGYRLSLMLTDEDKISEVKSKIPPILSGIEYISENGKNVVFKLPQALKSDYINLFSQLEMNKDNYGINKISLTVTTLDDVFLKAKQDADYDTQTLKRPAHQFKNSHEDLHKDARPTFVRKLKSLLFKRFYFFKRKFHLYLPGLLVALAIFIATFILAQGNTEYYGYGGPSLDINLETYGKTLVYYSGPDPPSNYYKSIVTSQNSDAVKVNDVKQSIIDKGIENIAFYKKHMIAAAEFEIDPTKHMLVNCLFSMQALHSAPISINLGMNAAVKAILGTDYSINVKNTPLKTIFTDVSPSEVSEAQVGILWFILVPIGALFLMSNFIVFPNFELPTNFIRIQIMAGVSPLFYWMSNVIFDYGLFIVKSILIFIVLCVINLHYDSFGSKELGVLIVIFFSYALAALPFMYLFSFKKTIAGGFALLIMVGLVTGLVPTIIIGVMEVSQDEYYENIAHTLKYVFIITCPQFALSYICVKFSRLYVRNYNWANMETVKRQYMCQSFKNPCCNGRDNTLQCMKYQSYFEDEELGIGNDIGFMLIAFLLYMSILWFLQTKYVEKLTSLVSNVRALWIKSDEKDSGDADSLSETSNDSQGLIANKISKKLGGRKIVRNVSMHVQKGKCFGLLGVNGAGKTTTFRMLTAELARDKGEIKLHDDKEKQIDIGDDNYCTKIGYCPQQDVLNFALTGRELIKTMATMKGCSNAEEVANILIELFDLEQYADKPCVQYSGGNKRKLNTSLAFIGLPSIILLDEPTSGVDPSARRKFWDTLSRVKKNNETSFVLCSHSMDECEALSDYIAIMKQGKIEAEGSLLELKQQHLKGFLIKIKLKPQDDATNDNSNIKKVDESVDCVDGISVEVQEPVEKDVKKLISRLKEEVVEDLFKDDPESQGNVEIKEDQANMLYCVVRDPNVRLSRLFSVADKLKAKYHYFIEDYTITDSSLEEVFLAVAASET